VNLINAGIFLIALALGREHAAVYANSSGLPGVAQLVLATVYYAVLVALVWQAGHLVRRMVEKHLTFTTSIVRRITKLKHGTSKDHTSDRHLLPTHRLLPILCGLAMLPSGFWLNVAILQRRGATTKDAIIWLAPSNAATFMIYFYLLKTADLGGLGPALRIWSFIVTSAVAVVVGVLLIDGLRLIRQSTVSRWSRAWSRIKPLWSTR
jgi:hypothetical protein